LSTTIPHDVEPSEGAEADEALAAHKAELLRSNQLADGIRKALRCAGFNADVFAEDLPGRVRDALTHLAERAKENQDAHVDALRRLAEATAPAKAGST
jgi:hypothetical protein